MMHLLFAFLLAIPTHAERALAYATPEDVLLQQLEYYQAENYLPPNGRQVKTLQEAMQQEREALHPSTFIDKGSVEGAVSSAEPVLSQNEGSSTPADHAAAGTSPLSSSPKGTVDGSQGETSSLDPSTLRLIQRLDRDPLHANATAEEQDTPLAPTGLGSMAALGIAMLGVGVTLWRAREKARAG